jgi:hypothetical protein
MMAEPEEGLYGFTLHQSHTQKSNPTNKQPSLKKRQPLDLPFYGAERHQIETQTGISEEIKQESISCNFNCSSSEARYSSASVYAMMMKMKQIQGQLCQ